MPTTFLCVLLHCNARQHTRRARRKLPHAFVYVTTLHIHKKTYSDTREHYSLFVCCGGTPRVHSELFTHARACVIILAQRAPSVVVADRPRQPTERRSSRSFFCDANYNARTHFFWLCIGPVSSSSRIHPVVSADFVRA